MNEDLIMAEMEEEENLEKLAFEINTLTVQMKRNLLSGIIEIGKRFEEAKQLIEFGQWGEFCEELTGYSQSMAENYIKVYKEYGSEQYNLFADFSNSESIANLGITKLLALTAIPAEEREEFVAENNITEDTTVKELQEKIKALTESTEDKEREYEEQIKKLEDDIEGIINEISEKDKKIEDLNQTLEEMEIEKQDKNIEETEELQQMIAEAEEKAREETKATLEAAQKAKEKAEEKLQKLKKKYEALENSKADSEALLTAEKEKVEAERVKNEELRKELERAKKTSDLSAQQGVVKVNLLFEAAQESIGNIKAALNDIPDESRENIRKAISDTLKGLADNI